jgi:hypothetical protein
MKSVVKSVVTPQKGRKTLCTSGLYHILKIYITHNLFFCVYIDHLRIFISDFMALSPIFGVTTEMTTKISQDKRRRFL